MNGAGAARLRRRDRSRRRRGCASRAGRRAILRPSRGPVRHGQPGELLAHDRGLQCPLRRCRRVLPVATAASAGAGVRARHRDPVRRRCEHLDGVGPAERPATVLGHQRAHPLSGQCVPHEHDPALAARDTEPAVPGRADLEDELAARPVVGHASVFAGSGTDLVPRHRRRPVRTRQHAILGSRARVELPRHAGHHDALLEQQPALEP